MKPLPKEFLDYAFKQRKELLKKALEGGLHGPEFFVAFTRHTPAIISYGSSGLNGSIKGIGFVHREEFISKTVEDLKSTLNELLELPMDEAKRLSMKFLLEEIYLEELVDFTILSSLELAKGHSWRNFQENPHASILFYTPPLTSYELRAKVEIHEQGPYWEFVNAVHDVFHLAGSKKRRDWSKTPAYIFHIKEIYDNSVKAMGKKIWP